MHFSPALSPALRRTTRLALVSCGLIALLASCGGDSVTAVPQRVAVSASPNGIAVRAADGAVFITDDQSNGVLSSPDGHTFAHYATVPVVAGQANSLSQLSFAEAGALMIERFGFGTASAVFSITGVDTIVPLSGPNPARRRLGLISIGAGGTLYTKCNTTGLFRIAPDGTISVLANDFQDARGVAVDAPRHQLYAIDRAPGTGGTSYVRIFPLN
ncbi:hypothetical protein PQR46_03340 [Paraburkholderia sediminicola]|uniref:hypothetical protein n=1 Tax=Paraburkholderia TaxID=1822464 RepID=UPI0038BB1D8B